MSLTKKSVGLSLAMAAGMAIYGAGCSSSSNGGACAGGAASCSDSGTADATKDAPVAETSGGDTGSAPDGSDSGGTPGCDPNAPFTPVPWAPPTPFTPGACDSTQIAAYLACVGTAAADCSAFRSVAANAACVACVETDVAAAAHGPAVTQTSGGKVNIIELNWGGCTAHFDGDSSAKGCGAQFAKSNDCLQDDCNNCSDAAAPTANGPFAKCQKAAFQTGTCQAFTDAAACVAEQFADGGKTTQCVQFPNVLDLWCGAVSDGGTDSGGGG